MSSWFLPLVPLLVSVLLFVIARRSASENAFEYPPWDRERLQFWERPWQCKLGLHAWGTLLCPRCGHQDRMLLESFERALKEREAEEPGFVLRVLGVQAPGRCFVCGEPLPEGALPEDGCGCLNGCDL